MISETQTVLHQQKEEEGNSSDSPADKIGRTPGIAEEISEDAYKQNYVYGSCATQSPRRKWGDIASD